MPFCAKCGKQHEDEASFCSHCGNTLRKIERVIERAVNPNIKKSSKGFVLFIIILIIIGYVVLDIWAISQLTPVVSLTSVFASISNFDYDVSLSKTSLESTIRIENPTFVPIIFGRVSYDANYGNTKVADGKTGFFILGPNSQKDIPADLTIYHLDTVWAGGKWLWNTITGKQERKYANFYADFLITKIKIGELE